MFLVFFQSLNEYVDSLKKDDKDDDDEDDEEENETDEEEENGQEELNIGHEIEWKPQLLALLRYGAWITSKRRYVSGWIEE